MFFNTRAGGFARLIQTYQQPVPNRNKPLVFGRITAAFSTFALHYKIPIMTIAIGNDHAGPAYKKAIVALLNTLGHSVLNFGTDTSESVDYPDFAHPVAQAVTQKKADFGIVICGSGNGIAMSANKHQGIRAAVCWTTEIASLARQHNDANIISIPARFTSMEQSVDMVKTFLQTPFEGGRHQNRVAKIACP